MENSLNHCFLMIVFASGQSLNFPEMGKVHSLLLLPAHLLESVC